MPVDEFPNLLAALEKPNKKTTPTLRTWSMPQTPPPATPVPNDEEEAGTLDLTPFPFGPPGWLSQIDSPVAWPSKICTENYISEGPGFLSVNVGDAVLICQKEEDTYIRAYNIPLQTSGPIPAKALS